MFNLKHALFPAMTVTTLLTACTGPVGLQDSLVKSQSSWNRLANATPNVDLNAPLSTDPKAEVDHTWWKHFEDPTLDLLIKEVLANNKTLQIAKARVEEARAGRKAAQSLLLPQINGAMGAQRANLGYFTNNQTVSFREAEAIASWDFDLFGRNQARTAAATAILQSEEASQQAVRVGLLAETARNYYDMRNYERQLDLTRQNLVTQKKTLELIRAQMQETKASDLDVQSVSAQVSSFESLLPILQTAYEASLNRLNVLLGVPPGSKDLLLKTSHDITPLKHHILIAAPAKVLATRPDICAAERRFAASISAKYVAETGWFPDISLTGFFGSQVATPFSSTPWGLSANLMQPILNFGGIASQIDAADAQQKQAFLGYQYVVLKALEDMESALSSYLNETIRNASLTTNVSQHRKLTALVKQKYDSGYASFLDVLATERNQLIAESNKAASDFSLRIDLVNVYVAAGGGWSDDGATTADRPVNAAGITGRNAMK